MCLGNVIHCRGCRQSAIEFRDICVVRLERPRERIPNHRVHGLHRSIAQCPQCRAVDQHQRQAAARRYPLDHRRAKAVLEHLQGRRSFPRPAHELSTEQCELLYTQRQRLHPFQHRSLDIELMTRLISSQTACLTNPQARQILPRWRECTMRQEELDILDAFPSAADIQHLSMAVIRNSITQLQLEEPQTTSRELYDQYMRRQRLHPFPSNNAALGEIVSILRERMQLHPGEPSYLLEWEECCRRQAEIDSTGRNITEEDLQHHLSEIPGFGEPELVPVNPPQEPNGGEDQSLNGYRQSNHLSEHFEIPVGFQEFCERNDELMDIVSRPRATRETLNEDIGEYSHYLEYFGHRYRRIFQQYVDQLQNAEQLTEDRLREFTPSRAPIREHRLSSSSEASVSNDAVVQQREIREEVPLTFAQWTAERGPRTPLVDEVRLLRDIVEYESEYLRQLRFPSRYQQEFVELFHRIARYDMNHFVYTIPTIVRTEVPDFHTFRQSNMSYAENEVSLPWWATHFSMLRGFETQLSSEMLPAYHRARSVWIENIRRELHGQPRDLNMETILILQSRVTEYQQAIHETTEVMEPENEAYITAEQMAQLQASVQRLRVLDARMRAFIARGRAPTQEELQQMHIAQTREYEARILNEVRRAIEQSRSASTQSPPETSSRRERSRTPASQVSDYDMEDLLRDLRIMREADEDDRDDASIDADVDYNAEMRRASAWYFGSSGQRANPEYRWY